MVDLFNILLIPDSDHLIFKIKEQHVLGMFTNRNTMGMINVMNIINFENKGEYAFIYVWIISTRRHLCYLLRAIAGYTGFSIHYTQANFGKLKKCPQNIKCKIWSRMIEIWDEWNNEIRFIVYIVSKLCVSMFIKIYLFLRKDQDVTHLLDILEIR